ncbi:MAG TPA: iron-sulfur cluster assembly protein [Puia sp.]|jgi:FeS assembly SUF system protein|nr:iron-sulfur cluster assembly protein [Puia sp.]
MSEMDEHIAGGAGASAEAASSGGEVKAGEPTMRERIEAVLRTVFDPEIPVNIFDLGLVYEIKAEDNGNVKITMTLTAPACPVAGDIVSEVQMKVEGIPGVMDCHVQLVFDPPWNKEMMTEEAKLELGFL